MNVTKTAVVSTISLIIAMSAVALSAGPPLAAQQAGRDSPAQQQDSPERQQARATPFIPVTGKQACLFNTLALPSGVATNTGLTVTFTIGVPRSITVLFSSEIVVLAAGNRVNLDYSIDGGPRLAIGPEFFATDFPLEATRTAFGFRTAALAAGTHTITPFLTANGAGGQAEFRCFTVGRNGG
jgi:hypothetical protein